MVYFIMRNLYQNPSAFGWSPPSTTTNSPTSGSMSGRPLNPSFFANSLFSLAPPGLSPTNLLNEKIRARDWDSATVRVLSNPSDAFYRAKQMNTTLHLACLYRAPIDLVELILDANPRALLCQDSEGWTPLHVVLLYGNDEDTALLLIRRGGAEAASIQSRIVGAPLHLACRHGCSTTIIKELLRVNPAMATTPNEFSTKPARILWHQYSRNPENERFLSEQLYQIGNNDNLFRDLPEERQETIRGIVDRLELLLLAAKGKQQQRMNGIGGEKSVIIHDVVVATEDTLGNLTDYLGLIVVLYPEQVRSTDEMGNFPLHKAASNRPSNRGGNLRRPVSMPTFTSTGIAAAAATTTTDGQNNNTRLFSSMEDPVEILVKSYPVAAAIPNNEGVLPLHIALSKGKRTWRTGIASMVLAAPQVLLTRDVETKLLPFQLAAVGPTSSSSSSDEETIEIIETILELLLACPHAMISSQ